jgi:hypothetical protein
MGKRPTYDNEDMELKALRSEMTIMNRRMDEVITILGGNSAYGLTGMKSDFRDLKLDVNNIKQEIEKIKKQESDRWNIPLKTIPQKIVAAVAFLALILTTIQSVKDMLNP